MRSSLVSLLLLATALPCHASLGGAPSRFDTATGGGVRALAAGATATTYSIQLSTLPGGTSVREYVARDGVVFAVSWKGPFLPDLRMLLGAHFVTLTAEAARQPKAGHSQLRVERPGVTIESTGHMRAYAGRAWTADHFPVGFTAQEIE